jgi:hypothetical protein
VLKEHLLQVEKWGRHKTMEWMGAINVRTTDGVFAIRPLFAEAKIKYNRRIIRDKYVPPSSHEHRRWRKPPQGGSQERVRRT